MVECPSCLDTFNSERAMKIHHFKLHDESLSGFDRNCKHCGDYFSARHKGIKYCSKKCSSESKVVDKTQICEQCDQTFGADKERKYCSLSCSAESQKQRTESVCMQCAKKFEHRTNRDAKYCSDDCRLKARWGDYEAGPTTKKSPRWRKFSKKYRSWVGECESCNSTENLHVHHDDPIFKGGALWDNTFTVLCKDCHLGNFGEWH